MTHADIRKCLDRCAECGAPAGYETEGEYTRARCTECNNTGEWMATKWCTVIPWNLEQRKMKGELAL